MERGYIKIKENNENQLIVEAKLVNCTLWITKHEIAALFNVFVNTIGNNLRSIFKSGLLHKEDVTRIHKYENNGRQCEMTEYNLVQGMGNESINRIYPNKTKKRSRCFDCVQSIVKTSCDNIKLVQTLKYKCSYEKCNLFIHCSFYGFLRFKLVKE